MCWIDAGSPGLDPDAGQVGMLMKPVMREHVAGLAGTWRRQQTRPAYKTKGCNMIVLDAKVMNAGVTPEGGQSVPALPDDATEVRCGERDGRRWAIYKATAPQLAIMAAQAAEVQTWRDRDGETAGFLNFSIAVNVGGWFGSEFVEDRAYRNVLQARDLNRPRAYVIGFVRGAVEVWQECLRPIPYDTQAPHVAQLAPETGRG